MKNICFCETKYSRTNISKMILIIALIDGKKQNVHPFAKAKITGNSTESGITENKICDIKNALN